MTTLRRHPYAIAAAALAIAIGAGVAVAAGAGFGAVGHAFARIHPAWLAVVAGAQAVGALGYAAAYQATSEMRGGPQLAFRRALKLVLAGFGPFTVAGGFGLDYEVLQSAESSERRARVRVLGLGALEYAVLAPAACICAIVLLATGSRAMPSLLWPWALAVPAGFGAAFWALAHRKRLTNDGARERLDEALGAIGVLRRLAVHPARGVPAFIGMAIYWAVEAVSLWAALRAFGTDLSAPAVVVAYATGYAATRRTLPLGGAGATEALMTYSLHWVGLKVPPALAAVAAYRAFNFVLPVIPGLATREAIEPLLIEEGDDRETVARLRGMERARESTPVGGR